jgi:signal transduction histidine kinase
VSFAILPPLWRRWWFLTSTLVLAFVALRAAERYRVARLLELERVRTRIATDLHDDVGSSLSQIAILSEVARQRLGADGAAAREALASIAATSREMVDSMGDIVWAINPRKDHLSDLTHRMRRFASDVLTARGIALRFHAPEGELGASIGPDLRRHAYLIFKESVNNLARHSGCSEAQIEIGVEGGTLVVEVADNGRGFAEDGRTEGLGSTTLRERAAQLGGELKLHSEPGRGTRVSLRVPLK